MKYVKIKRISLKDQIKEALIEKILAGHLNPGDRIKELSVAKEFGTSQAPVREAIRCLEVLGYIEHQAHIGARVKEHHEKDFKNAYDIWESFERYAVAYGLSRLKENVDTLKAALAQMTMAAKHRDLFAYAENDIIFHRSIIQAMDNQKMLDIWNGLLIYSRITNTLFKTKMNLFEAVNMHPPIIEAIQSEDIVKATQAIAQHYKTIKMHRNIL